MRPATSSDSYQTVWLSDNGGPRKLRTLRGIQLKQWGFAYEDTAGVIWDTAEVPETPDELRDFEIAMLKDKVAELEDKIDNLIDRLRGD